jgi:hypothetical protein
VHQVDFIMFQPTLEKLLNIEQIFTKFSFKSKQKNLGKFLRTFYIVGTPLLDRI